MNAAIQWTYEKRDPISYTGAILLLALVLLVINFAPAPDLAPDENEMSAFLDTPPPPPKLEPIQKVEPQPVVKQLPVQLPLSKAPSPVDIPEPPKQQETKPSIPAPQPVVQPPTPPVPTPPIAEPVAKQPPVSLDSMYVGQLKAYLEKIKKYPSSREARLARPQGTVTLSLTISRSGQLMDVHVLNSSHSNILDAEAMKSVKTATLPPFPQDAFGNESSHEFSVNLNYTLEQ